ncbi:hypothetical protein CAEBREN_25697 [Caenorhabditis brenneri]|uniref:poly(ADP-ribose) glycohydrolase n=2 Tax=Caenorhabditis brenneri TaxID=135651 RepID=G0PJD6_CAEBE|nr:hypothetical protein CAEBREN_25697 [Caenorhabditis brenneri]
MEQSFADYIGTGEAHYVPPAMKKPKFMDAADLEPAEPKSIDVFANSDPGSQESSSQGSTNDYETCAEGGMDTSLEEGAGLQIEEEEEVEPPTPKPEELGSKTIRFSPEKTPKIGRKSQFSTQNAQKSTEKCQNSEQSPSVRKNYYPIFTPQRTPNSAQRHPFLAQKTPNSHEKRSYSAEKTPNSVRNEQDSAQKRPYSARQDPYSAEKRQFSPENAPKSIKKSPFSAQTPGSMTSNTPYYTPNQPAKTPKKESVSIKQAGKTLRRSLFDEDPDPVPKIVDLHSDGSDQDLEREDGSMEEEEPKKFIRIQMDAPPPMDSDGEDDEVIEGMEEERRAESRKQHRMPERSPSTVTYGPLNDSPKKGPQVKKEQTPYQHTHHPADEALEEEEDDDDEQYFQPVQSTRKVAPELKKEESDEEFEVEYEPMEIDDSQERAQAGTESQESPEKTPDSRPQRIQTPDSSSRKRERVASSSDQITDDSPPDSQEDRAERAYRQQFIKNAAEFRDNELVFRPDIAIEKPETNYVYCDIPGLPKREMHQRPTDGPYSSIINQLWSTTDERDNPNAYYAWQKAHLTNWLKDYRSNGSCYQLFVGLIHDMMDLPPTILDTLDKYYYRKCRETSNETVMRQFSRVVRLALLAEEILPAHIYLLIGDVRSATLSHLQCATLVARMFFNKRKVKYGSPENLNFLEILEKGENMFVEKLYFLFEYTDKMATDPPKGVVSFRRCFAKEESKAKVIENRQREQLPIVRFLDTMNIEETTLCTQVDFANMRIGGGVLGWGFVQEEIRFLMCPEMLVSMMLLPREMYSNEAFSIVGAYVFSSYDGYGTSTKWRPLKPKHARQNEPSNRDKYGRLRVETIAIDALKFSRNRTQSLNEQLDTANIRRETFKAWQGFSSQMFGFKNIPIVSGWWGCGAFGGNKAVKFIIQVVAAGIANRPLHICTFGDSTTAEQCSKFLRLMKDNRVSIGKLYTLLRRVPKPVNHWQQTDFYVFDAICKLIRDEERGF